MKDSRHNQFLHQFILLLCVIPFVLCNVSLPLIASSKLSKSSHATPFSHRELSFIPIGTSILNRTKSKAGHISDGVSYQFGLIFLSKKRVDKPFVAQDVLVSFHVLEVWY